MQFDEGVRGLLAGDFSRLAPLFEGYPCFISQWHAAGRFAKSLQAFDEAMTAACFLGRTQVAEYLLVYGVSPSGGNATGLNAFHWASNRGQLEVVQLLIRYKASLETRNCYGGTVLGGTVWAAVREPKPDHLAIIEVLLAAGANVREAAYPSGDRRVDEVLHRYRGKISRKGTPSPQKVFQT